MAEGTAPLRLLRRPDDRAADWLGPGRHVVDAVFGGNEVVDGDAAEAGILSCDAGTDSLSRDPLDQRDAVDLRSGEKLGAEVRLSGRRDAMYRVPKCIRLGQKPLEVDSR